jgi:hypothetical protein
VNQQLVVNCGPVGPGDVVLYRGASLDGDQTNDLAEKIRESVGHDQFLLVLLPEGAGFDILDEALMRQHGWVRAPVGDGAQPG